MKSIKRSIFCILTILLAAQVYAETYDVKKYGAVGDGKTIDTAAINTAIEAAAEAGGGTQEQAAIQPPENEKEYPEPSMFGPMPAYGFYLRHVDGIEMNNVQVNYMTEDHRPAFILNEVKNAAFNNVRAQHEPQVPTFVLKDVENFSTHRCGVADMQIDKGEREEL